MQNTHTRTHMAKPLVALSCRDWSFVQVTNAFVKDNKSFAVMKCINIFWLKLLKLWNIKTQQQMGLHYAGIQRRSYQVSNKSLINGCLGNRPILYFSSHTSPLNENTVICGAQQVSAVIFLIIWRHCAVFWVRLTKDISRVIWRISSLCHVI